MTEPKPISRRRALATTGLGGLAAATMMAGAAMAQSPRQKVAYPRLSRAIREMEETKAFLAASPRRFGGYKARAISALEVAIVDLKLAMQHAG